MNTFSLIQYLVSLFVLRRLGGGPAIVAFGSSPPPPSPPRLRFAQTGVPKKPKKESQLRFDYNGCVTWGVIYD